MLGKKIQIIGLIFGILLTGSIAFAVDDAPPELIINPDPAPDNDAPPSLDISGDPDPAPDPDPDPSPNPDPDPDPVDSSGIKITNADIFPKGFNPTVNDTEVTFTTSANAKIEVKIINNVGQTVVKLIDNQSLNAGDHSVKWNGTDSNNDSGKIVDTGTYRFKITARDPETGQTADTAEGSVNVIYANSTPTPEQNKAIVAVQNATSGTTASTGPGVLLYAVFPLAGYLYSRRNKS